MLYFVPDIAAIIAQITSRATSSMADLLKLMDDLSTVGMPLIINQSGSSLKVYVSKAMIMPAMSLINEVILDRKRDVEGTSVG